MSKTKSEKNELTVAMQKEKKKQL